MKVVCDNTVLLGIANITPHVTQHNFSTQFYDAITSDLVAEIGGNREYDVFGFDTITSRTMIIQLECTKPGMCSPTPHNSFHLNVYCK